MANMDNKISVIRNLGETVCTKTKHLFVKTAAKNLYLVPGNKNFTRKKGLTNKPKRCPDCRKARRQKNRRRMYDAVCSKCGAQTQVPFKPMPGREVLCKACFDAQKQGA